ncbi:MAG: hypothetical protein IT518_05930 [Burkholderiales bacterium]|nr:hypothetical protein [Burkholderiales bacterium]
MVACALACLIVAACAAPPSPEPTMVLPAPLPAISLPAPVCPQCIDQSQEIARLREDLASREAELKDLRSSQREQVKMIQETTREATRAKAKLRRLATQADAASYLAEVEVALAALRATLPGAPPPMLVLAQGLLDAAAAPFREGDYGAAMDRTAQAEQLVSVVADQLPRAGRARVPGEVALSVTIPLRVVADTHLRREPAAKAALVASVKKDSPVTAQAYKGGWMRVAIEDGRIGWMSQAQLGAR